MRAACEIVADPSACPIVPSSPATRPAPKIMKTAIPFAVDDRKTEPRSDSPATRATAHASVTPGQAIRSGHQWPTRPVIVIAAR